MMSRRDHLCFIAQVVYLGTVGGVRVDKDLRVLDAYMKAIPDLYWRS